VEEVLGEKIQCKNIRKNSVRSCENAILRGKWSTPQKKRTWIIFLYEKNEKTIIKFLKKIYWNIEEI